MPNLWVVLSALFVFSFTLFAQEEHSHSAPEKLGDVSFPITCTAAVQQEFNRAVALLHSFAYDAAEQTFRRVVARDPQCSIAHWGIAMTHFHQLWEPSLSPATNAIAYEELRRARSIGKGSERERKFVDALTFIYEDISAVPYRTRLSKYEHAMSEVAGHEQNDAEAQVFYALALLANGSPKDKSHSNQKRAAELLEPLYRAHPQHPGMPHYLIHAYDNAELAPRGLVAARAYSEIAPSAPHALHMPSHIFTRLGLWDDSISSNLAARKAAHQQSDIGEELHAMDYLVYAYLQTGREKDAAQVVQQLKHMSELSVSDFKLGYASTAIPIRYMVERNRWIEAAKIVSPTGVPPHVVAIAVWARGLGLARTGRVREAHVESDVLRRIEIQLRNSGNEYWANQTRILEREVEGWAAQANGKRNEAVAFMREAADEEDAMEKLPVTPGPIIPAREQLGYLLMEQNQPGIASREFEAALLSAPGRRGALTGASHAAELSRR
jgi:tetratricopeptide (TPR) repeat protein